MSRRLAVIAAGLVVTLTPAAQTGDSPPRPEEFKVIPVKSADLQAVLTGVTTLIGEGGELPTVGFPDNSPAAVLAGKVPVVGSYTGSDWRVIALQRPRAVAVRGSAHDVRVAADVVALLDRPVEAEVPKLQTAQAFPLRHPAADGVEAVIQALEFEGVRTWAAGPKLLVIAGGSAAARAAVVELVKELDIGSEAKPTAGK